MKSKRLAIFGASGRLGRAIAALALTDPRFSLVAALTHASSSHLGVDLGSLLNQKPVGVSLAVSSPQKSDLFIDASLPSGLSSRLALAIHSRCPIVIGTTGFTDADNELLKQAASQIPVFHACNFSIGMALMQRLARDTSRIFPSAHVDLIETHRSQKKDLPSGSALLLAQSIQQPVKIHSIRSGHVIGDHTLFFNTPDERLTLTHEAHSRDAFARGALEAAAFLITQKPGLYNMDSLLHA
jgi:4-hydroxy-tetrahydrodipicolinate reductase